MGYRNKPASKIWLCSRAEMFFTSIAPVAYYMEESINANEIENNLQDASMYEFEEKYKNYHHNYFFKLGNKNVCYYSDGAVQQGRLLLVNEQFFLDYKEAVYYCKKESLNIAPYLVKEHYPNEREYEKVVNYFTELQAKYFEEGSKLVSFQFYQKEK